MNATQENSLDKLIQRADPDKKHTLSRRSSPIMESLRCTCGWSAAEHRQQNALAREAKLFRKIRTHFLEVLQKLEAA